MDASRHLSRAVADVPTASVAGRYYRFTSQRRIPTALDGSSAGGRWGPQGGFPVLYLTDDYEGCVIEAYRHVADPTGPAGPSKIRYGLITCDIQVDNIVNLTTATARMSLGLDPAILYSEPQQPDGAAYEACIRVAKAAHQLGRHGILAPAATSRGLTLALFMDVLPSEQRPERVGPATEWVELPADPRRLRMVRPDQ